MTASSPIVEVSPEFRRQAFHAILAIFLFVLVYFLLLAAAVGIAYLAWVSAWGLFYAIPNIVTTVAGLGMLAAAGLLVFFMVKFLFHRSETDNTADQEVTRAEEPALFALLDDIVSQLEVQPPMKVFLGPEVNASVTYNSSFWSMFFPVRKNLRIGLGLLHSLTVEELRAVIAHEFGHFSQRSMAVGSYVYTVNYIIFNLVNDDEQFNRVAGKIAGFSVYIYPFAWVALMATQGAKWVLAKMYELVNLSYLGLSREMEYHADAVAASLGTGQVLASGLRRIELAAECYEKAVTFTGLQLVESRRVTNLYPLQALLLQETARKDGLALRNGLPDVPAGGQNKYLTSRLTFDQQWASHPAIEDRISHLNLAAEAQVETTAALAITLLTSRQEREEALTSLVTRDYPDSESFPQLSPAESRQFLLEQEDQNELPGLYNGYYDAYNLIPEASLPAPATTVIPPTDLFSSAAVKRVNELTVLDYDIAILTAITKREIAAKTFDYDGKKYRRRQAKALLSDLQHQAGKLREAVAGHEQEVIASVLAAAGTAEQAAALRRRFAEFVAADDDHKRLMGTITAVQEEGTFLQETLPYDAIRYRMIKFDARVANFRQALSEALEHPVFALAINPVIREDADKFLAREQWTYFRTDHYDEAALEVLSINLKNLEFLLNRGYWLGKRALLQEMAAIWQRA